MLLVRRRRGSAVLVLGWGAGCFTATGRVGPLRAAPNMASIGLLRSPITWPGPGTAPTTVGGSSTTLAIDVGILAGIVKRTLSMGERVARGFTTTSAGGGTGAGGRDR